MKTGRKKERKRACVSVSVSMCEKKRDPRKPIPPKRERRLTRLLSGFFSRASGLRELLQSGAEILINRRGDAGV